MTEFEKQIYNNFLIVSRSIKNKPFSIRKDFKNFEDTAQYPYVYKLSVFFERFPHLDIKTFFEAPYFVLDSAENDYFPLNFYCSQKAVSTYKQYHENYLIDHPDSTQSLEFIKNSFLFIKDYCWEHDIPLKEYVSVTNATPAFVEHVKNRKISVYILFAFSDFEKHLKNVDYKLISDICPVLNKIGYIRTKFLVSTKARVNVNKIKKFVENQKG